MSEHARSEHARSEHASIIGADSPVAAVTAFDLETASPSADLETLARHMARNDVGALVIQATNGDTAILTERDIVHAVAFDVDAWAVDVMTRDVIEVASAGSLAAEAGLVCRRGVCRLVGVGADGVDEFAVILEIADHGVNIMTGEGAADPVQKLECLFVRHDTFSIIIHYLPSLARTAV